MLQFFSRLSFTCRLSLLLGVASKILKNASFYLYFCIRNLYANFEKGDTFYYMKTKKTLKVTHFQILKRSLKRYYLNGNSLTH